MTKSTNQIWKFFRYFIEPAELNESSHSSSSLRSSDIEKMTFAL